LASLGLEGTRDVGLSVAAMAGGSSPKAQQSRADAVKHDGVWAVVKRNPTGMAMLGLFGLVTLVANMQTQVVSSLAAEIWGHNMTSIRSAFQVASLAMGVVFAAPYGRFGDQQGNRLACAILVVIISLPLVAFSLFGLTARGLWFASGASLLQGFTGITMVGAPCMYALGHEVARPGDFAVLTALAFATTNIVSIIGTVIAEAIQRRGGDSAVVWFGITVGAFAIVGLLLLPRRKERDADVITAGDLRGDNPSVQGGAADAQRGAQGASCSVFASVHFAVSHPLLLRLCVITMLLCTSEAVATDVMTQYILECLGWLGGAVALERRTALLFNTSLTMQASIGIGSWFLGLVSARCSAFSVLVWVSLTATVLQMWPPVMVLVPQIWCAFAIAVCVGVSMFAAPATATIVPLVSPPGRVGEAMGAMGSFKCLSFLVGNLMCVFIVPLLQRSGISNPLWLTFPLCSACALCAVPLATKLRREAGVEEQQDEQRHSPMQGADASGPSALSGPPGRCGPLEP